MPNDLRPTGIEALGEMPWGTHLCHFYETKQDLLDILVPYFKTGLESNEFCLWIISSSLNVAEAAGALQKSVPDLEKHLAKRSLEILVPSSAAEVPDWEAPTIDLKSHVANGSIEIVPHDQWYLDGGKFDPVRVINRWKEKLHQALAHGYSGMRVHGNEAWLKETDWKNFLAYERQLNEMIAGQRMIVLCTYPLGTRKAGEIFDVARTHQLAIAKRHGHWEMLETPEIKQTKVKLAELTENLERRVRKRTSELTLLNQQFQETQRKLEEAQRIAHVGHWERDLKTDAVTWSAEIYRIFGLSPEGPRILFPQFLKLIHPEDRARIARAVDESARGLHHYAVEYRILRADNEVRFVRSEGEVLRDENGQPLRAFGILEDITERKRMEDALRESEGQLRLVIDTLPMMAWIVLPDGSLDFINKRWLAYSGLSLEEALKDPIGTMHPEDLAAVKEKWSTCMASSKAYEGEMRLRRGDGEYRWFLVRTEPFFDGQGNLLRWYGTSTDIEDRKRAEGALRDTQAVLAGVMRATVAGELTASIAHEVNQPLGAVVTNANAALRWLNGNPPVLDEVREALQRIVRDG
ncbi:MAG: sensory transduction histidine kinase, partial [Verrucomicrobiales bacterium]|nr:sensory transduction histidine kinase [Verrucomicrobiales bacterium]